MLIFQAKYMSLIHHLHGALPLLMKLPIGNLNMTTRRKLLKVGCVLSVGNEFAPKYIEPTKRKSCFLFVKAGFQLFALYHPELDHIDQCFPPAFGAAEGEFQQHGIFIYLHIRFLVASRAWNPMRCPVFVVHSVDLRF